MRVSALLGLSSLFVGGLAAAQTTPARIEGGAVVVGSKRLPIPIEAGRIDTKNAIIEPITIAEGVVVTHVKVPDRERPDLAFEALVSPNREAPIWSGLTGYTHGSEGDRSGDVVMIFERDTTSKFVIVAETREDTRICGQALTPLGARGIDPNTLELRGATLHRIEKKTRDEAAPIVAVAGGDDVKPLARLLKATGGSAPFAASITDGDPSTVWSEQRPGDGHGEFVTMRAPAELEIESILITPAPKAGKKESPRTFFLATDDKVFQITMPGDAKPGARYSIPMPHVKTSCIAIVLDEAYAHGKDAPEVGIAEIAALTKFDAEKATLADVAKALPTARGDEAAALLRRAGEPGLEAVASVYASFGDFKGRALAVDVAASSGSCDGAAGDLLTRALADRETEVRKRALGRIERCGKNAGPALVLAVQSTDEARRAAAAPLLASVAPGLAIEPLAEQMGKGSVDTRRAMRSALSRAAAAASRDRLLGLLKKEMPMDEKLDLVRALAPKLAELRPESDQAIADILKTKPDFATRYRIVMPLAALARSTDATSGELTRLSDMIKNDPEWGVRAHAVEAAMGIGPLLPAVAGAASDPEPRVREAAMRAFGKATEARPVTEALAKDEWTFVRVAAAEALGAMPSNNDAASSLDRALDDKSAKVRFAVVNSLATLKASGSGGHIRERLEAAKEDPDVRAAAARALGAMCVQNATSELTKHALAAKLPTNEANDRIGIAAIEALGALHPKDIEQRLAPLVAKDSRLPVRRAALRAIAEPTTCN